MKVGVLALQGAFQEHSVVLERLGAQTAEVRVPDDLEGLDGIVLPGGESTAMAIVEGGHGLFSALKQWVADDKPASR